MTDYTAESLTDSVYNSYYVHSSMLGSVRQFHGVAEISDRATPEALALQKSLIFEEFVELSRAVLANNIPEILDAAVDLWYVCLGRCRLTHRLEECDIKTALAHNNLPARTRDGAYSRYEKADIFWLLHELEFLLATDKYDYVYIALLSLLQQKSLLGYFFPAFESVHENNMTKFNKGVIRDEAGKIVKPDGYVPFDAKMWLTTMPEDFDGEIYIRNLIENKSGIA